MTGTRSVAEAAARVRERLAPLIRREIASIASIDTAIARESGPDFVVLLHDTKMAKQANVEQLATVIRVREGVPEESGGFLKALLAAQVAVLEHVSRTATFRAMRSVERELIRNYTAALESSDDDMERRALRKALGRALVHAHVLTAHIAKATGHPAEIGLLPHPLGDYFAGSAPRACMRCNLDRPGRVPPLERLDPHPFTFICAGCHADVLGEFPADLASQMDGWPEHVRHARVIQRAIGRPSKLNATCRVLFPLSGLPPDLPVPAADRALDIPAMTPVPGPAPGEQSGELHVPVSDDAEGRYCAQLFGYRAPREHW